MDNISPGTLSFWHKVSLKIILYRKSLLGRILSFAHIKQVQGHWIYIRELNADSVIVDLGANKGAFSSEIYESYGSDCYAIEPNIELYNNINDNNITKLNYAIASSNGTVNFYVSNNNEASSIIKDFENLWGNNKTVNIEALDFCSLINKLNINGKKIEILKIDIEGAELELIESLDYDQVKDIKQITVEFHDWINEDLHERTVKAIRKICFFGFDAYTDTPNHKWPVEMLFLNNALIKPVGMEKLYLKTFNKVAFLNY